MLKLEVVTGFNTKQLWVYDEANDTYIDPPKEVLDEIDARFDQHDWDGKEAALQEIVDTDPNWLRDAAYTYDAETTEI